MSRRPAPQMPTDEQARRAAEQAVRAVVAHSEDLARAGLSVSAAVVGPDGLRLEFSPATGQADPARGISLEDRRRRRDGGRAA